MKNRLEDYRNGYHPWIVSGVLRFIDNTHRTTRWYLNVTGWKTKRSIPRALPGSFLIKCDSLDVLNTTRHEIIETNFQFVRYPSEILDFFTNLHEYLFSVFLIFSESIPIRWFLINIFNRLQVILNAWYVKQFTVKWDIRNNGFISKNYSRRSSREVLLHSRLYPRYNNNSYSRSRSASSQTALAPKSSSSRGKALIRTSRDEIMQNLEAQRGNDLHFGIRRKDAGSEVRGSGGRGKVRMNRGAGLRPRNISWSSVDLRRCGQPDTPNSLSRSNLIGRPQRLYADLV